MVLLLRCFWSSSCRLFWSTGRSSHSSSLSVILLILSADSEPLTDDGERIQGCAFGARGSNSVECSQGREFRSRSSMVVECGFNMAASKSLSTVQGLSSSSSDGRASGQNGNHAMLPLQSVAREDDTVRINGNNNCEDNQQFRVEFLSASRRKRVNRSAKVKQYKLDARREQWLSQGSQGKEGKAELEQLSVEPHQWNCEHHYKAASGECMAQERTGSSGHSRSQGSSSSGSMSERTPVGSPATYHRFSGSGTSNDVKNTKKEAPGRRQVVSSRAPRYFRDEEELHGESERRHDLATNGRSSSDASKPRSNSSCASSSYTGSDSEGNDETHDAEDDWESAFDALHIQSSSRQSEGAHKGLSSDRALHSDARELHDKKQNGAHHHHHHHHHHHQHYHHHPDAQIAKLKPEYRYRNSDFGGRRGNGGRAWRSDDVSRPPTLPRLRVQQHAYSNHSSNNNHQGWGNIHGNMWESQQPASPSYCPICTEELDMTDSSYLPCTCGFQLCLFCYHRISSDDGRCPGCRKAYDTDLAVQLSRSSSVWVRV